MLIQNVFGGSFGGPIKHNKLFIFGNYQGIRTHAQGVQNTAGSHRYRANRESTSGSRPAEPSSSTTSSTTIRCTRASTPPWRRC